MISTFSPLAIRVLASAITMAPGRLDLWPQRRSASAPRGGRVTRSDARGERGATRRRRRDTAATPRRSGDAGRVCWLTARGEEDVPAQSVLKLLGSEAMQRACEDTLNSEGPDGLVLHAVTAPFAPLNLDSHYGSWFDRYVRTFAATIAGGTSEVQRNIIAERILGLPRN